MMATHFHKLYDICKNEELVGVQFKHLSVEFDVKSIFQFQETAIDNVVKMIERERNSKKSS